MTSSLISKYDIIIIILMSQPTKEGKNIHCFIIFEWINLRFGVEANNVNLRISNLKSKVQYQFEILREMPRFFS